MKRSDIVKRTVLVSLAGNTILATAKIIVGIIAGSLAVLGDGIDSFTDILISLVALVATIISSKPSDKKHPYGHARAETIATTILAFIIFFAGAQLVLSAIHTIQDGAVRTLPAMLGIWITLVSIVGKLLLAWNQSAAGKKTGSAMLMANAKNMSNDVIISSSVLVGLSLSHITKMPILDPIVAIFVGIWVMKSAISVFREVNDEIMDGNVKPALYQTIFDAVKSVPGAGNPHKARVRCLASLYDIDLDIEIDGDKTVTEAHEITQAVEQAIKARIDNVYDIVVHIEPAGAGEHDEQFGLKESNFN